VGRWTAKLAIAARLGLPPAAAALRRIELRPASSGAPRAFVDGSPARLSVSLSHSGGVACCAVMDADAALGCDIERIEARAAPFAGDYFNDRERLAIASWPAALRNTALTLHWSAKESVLKALETGLRADPLAVSVTAPAAPALDDGWLPLCAAISGSAFAGWWRAGDGFIRTVVAEPAPPSPETLDSATDAAACVRCRTTVSIPH
jgi:phosphopantetheinyl transferase (holo-ACP synthase)